MRLAIVCSESRGRIDAITQYSVLLCRAFAASGRAEADLHLRRADGSWIIASPEPAEDPPAPRSSLAGGIVGYDVLVVQYNPFIYGQWGFAPWFAAELLRVRGRRPPVRVALMVHEPYVPMTGWKWTLMGLWQRVQLHALRSVSDVVFTSIEAWTDLLRRAWPRRPTYHLPVASNLPDRRNACAETRSRLGVAEDEVVLGALGTGHPSRLLDYIVSAVNAVARTQGRAVLLHLGAGSPRLPGLDQRVELHRPGELPEDVIAAYLAAADLFLAPFIDGVSTRRTSVMSALQHGLAVLGTDGQLTDTLLRDSAALRLTPEGRPDLFAEAALKLASHEDERRELGAAGRALYESRFDWPVLAGRSLDLVEESARQ
jgi:glycosyltransferase involved in cell wall biosynthesis